MCWLMVGNQRFAAQEARGGWRGKDMAKVGAQLEGAKQGLEPTHIIDNVGFLKKSSLRKSGKIHRRNTKKEVVKTLEKS